jgi:hypothetical protein
MQHHTSKREVLRERAKHAALWLLGNGHNGHADITIDDVARWWMAASDADRAALVKSIGVGSAWKAIEANLA